jgi:hypothetical protein
MKTSSNYAKSSSMPQSSNVSTSTSKLEAARQYLRERNIQPYRGISLLNPGQLMFPREFRR